MPLVMIFYKGLRMQNYQWMSPLHYTLAEKRASEGRKQILHNRNRQMTSD